METISKLLYLLAAVPVVFLLAKPIYYSSRVRIIIIFLHAFVLVLLTIFVFNKPGWRWSEQRDLIGLVKDNEQEAYHFIQENFILVDNSYDKVLLPYEEGDEDDSTSFTLTNRKSLTSFLKLVNQNKANIDFVVCDIGFDFPTNDDSALKTELLQLRADDKLLLSLNGWKTENTALQLADEVYGNISEEGNEQLFVSHIIKRNEYYSLPYKLYHSINKIKTGEPFLLRNLFWEKDSVGRTSLATNTFFPEFSFTDEKMLTENIRVPGNNAGIQPDTGYEQDSRHYYFLSQPLSEYGQIEFSKNLSQRKKKGYKNIIFIGTFTSPDEDIHQTLYEPLHGPTILLNILYALHQGKHHLSLGFLLLLFIGYFLVSYVLVYACLKLKFFPDRVIKQAKIALTWTKDIFLINKKNAPGKSKRNSKKKGIYKEKSGFAGLIRRTVIASLDFIFIEEIHFVLLLLLIGIVKFLTGYLINGMSLLIYFGVINLSLKYAKEKIITNTKI